MLQDPRGCLDKQIADLMPVGIVDRLEIIQISDQEADRILLGLSQPGDFLIEVGPIVKTRERIV